MIKPITKEYFYKIVGENEDYIKKVVELENVSDSIYKKNHKEKEFPFASLNMFLYFEKPEEGVFVYLSDISLVIIPKKFESMTISRDEVVDFSDWELERISPIPNTMYTINCLSYTSAYHDYLYSCEDLMKNLQNGEFIIKNDRIGFSSEPITVRRVKTWSEQVYLGYPEKLEIPHNMTKLHKKDRILKNMLLWTQS
jgi:hypothetical protein